MNNNIIYRQDAINSIKELPRWIMDPNGEFQPVDPPTVSMIDPEDAVSAIENLPSAQLYSETDIQKIQDLEQAEIQKAYELGKLDAEPQWIPCSERLPEEKDTGILKLLGKNKMSNYVIATVEVKGERMTTTACTYDGVWHWDMKYAFPDYKIIAWMPLPAPYTERREE